MAIERTEVTTVLEVDLGMRNRLTAFFRLLLVIPAAILLSLLTNGGSGFSNSASNTDGSGHWGMSGGMVPTAGIALLLLFVGTYPTWLLSFVHAIQSFSTRVAAYALLLRDEYPNINERPYAAVVYPDIAEGATLSRALPIVKWLLAIPHYLLLLVTAPAVGLVTFMAWLAILFTGRYPAGLASFVVWYVSYANRVYGYAFALVSDSYPRVA